MPGRKRGDKATPDSALSRRERKRRLWFDRGADAWRRIGGHPAGYMCPTCLRVFDDVRDLSLEHVPPKSRMGGRPLVLTCRECNSNFGAKLDTAIIGQQVNIDFAHGELTQPARSVFKVGDAQMNADIEATGNGIAIWGAPKESEIRRDKVIEAMRNAGPNVELKIELRGGRQHPRRAYVGILRHAYLVGFAMWGYTYLSCPAFDRVRAQIHNYDETILGHFSVDVPKFPSRERVIALVTEPAWLDAVMVAIGPTAVFLPKRSDVDPYDQLQQHWRSGEREQFNGRPYIWPTEPMHALDVPLGDGKQ